jgi:undecaprenyl-diphosphatase
MNKLSQKHMRMIFLAVIILLSIIIFKIVVNDVFSELAGSDSSTLIFDKSVLKMFRDFRGEDLNQAMLDITALGSFSVITLFTCVLVILFIAHKDWKGISYIFFMTVGSLSVPPFFKNLYVRARPDALERLQVVKSTSFPSGHAFTATVTYLSLAFLLSRELKEIKLEILYYILAFVVIAFVATSRMYLGVHYPTDIIGGVCLGLIWFSLVSIPFIYYSKATDSV